MLVRVRKAEAKPCVRKGKDNHRPNNRCECEALCKSFNGFKERTSTGTLKYIKNETEPLFKGCIEIEEYLIDNLLLRYDCKEKSGLDVLFNGIDKIHSLNASYLDIDNLGLTDIPDNDLTIGEALDSYTYEVENQLLDSLEDFEDQEPSLYIDECAFNYIPSSLGYGHSMAHDIFASAPESMDEVVFNYLFKRGEFERGSNDLYAVAKCVKQRRDLEEDIRVVWPRYTKKRYEKNLEIIKLITEQKAPFWASRFKTLWDKLTTEQEEAIRAEYFYEEDEKPTQKEIAKRLNIDLSSYKDRLFWANKKIVKLFPEYEPIARRTKKKTKVSKPEPLYQILENGERIEILIETKTI